MIDFSRVGITSFSLLPMKIILVLGLILSFLGAILTAAMFIVKYFISPDFFSGTALLASFIVLNNGILLVVLGIISLYQINMLQQLQNRPTNIILEEV